MIAFYFLEDLVADYWNDSFVGTVADHGIAFSGAGLAVCEEAAVVALPLWGDMYQALSRMLDPIS